MQSKLLNAHPHAHVRVYAIWVNKLFGDARNRWDAAGLPDQRVVHLWDADDVSGGWLAANVTGYQGSDWDTYLLFGPDATWTSKPAPLRHSGSPVDHQIDERRRALDPLLATPEPPPPPETPPNRSLDDSPSRHRTAGNGAVTLIDRLGPGEAPAGAVHAARSRSERSDVYSMWQTPEPARSGPSQGDQVTGRSGGAGAIQGGAAPPLRMPGAYALNPSNPHRAEEQRT